MPATPIYRAEVTYEGNLGDAVILPADAASYSVFFYAADTFNAFGIEGRIIPDNTTVTGFRLTYILYFNAGGDPNTWSLISGTSSLPSGNTDTSFPSLSTLSITKDFDNDLVIWDTPLGTQSRPLSGFVSDNTRLRPGCFGDGIVGGNAAVDHEAHATFMHWYGYENGAPYLGAEMTGADPGVWLATTQYTTGAGTPWPNTDVQAADGYTMGFASTAGSGPYIWTRRLRCWNGGDNLTVVNPNFRVDMTKSRISGEIALAAVMPEDPSQLWFWWSDDDGKTLNPVSVEHVPRNNYRHPNIISFPDGSLALFFLKIEPNLVYLDRSRNGGRTWTGDPNHYLLSPLGNIAGLRVRLDPTGQLLYFLYIDKSNGRLQLSRFGALGDSVVGIGTTLVDTGVVNYDQPDLYWDEAGNVYASYAAGATGIPVLVRSTDLGQTWSPAATFSTIAERRRSSSQLFGLTAHSYQDQPSSFITVEVSENGGIAPLYTQSINTGFQVLGPQYAALAVGDRNQIWVAYMKESLAFPGTHVPQIALSSNLGVNWSLPTTSPPP